MHVIHVHAIQVKQFSVKLFYLHRFTWTVKFSGSVRFYYYIKGEAYTTSMCASNMLLNMWLSHNIRTFFSSMSWSHTCSTTNWSSKMSFSKRKPRIIMRVYKKTQHQPCFEPLGSSNYGMGIGLMECLIDFNELPQNTLHQHSNGK